MELYAILYDNHVITQPKRYNEEEYENICEEIHTYFPTYSYEEVRIEPVAQCLKLTYYKNQKQEPFPKEWLKRKHEFGPAKNPSIRKLIGHKLPLNTWTNIDVVFELINDDE